MGKAISGSPYGGIMRPRRFTRQASRPFGLGPAALRAAKWVFLTRKKPLKRALLARLGLRLVALSQCSRNTDAMQTCHVTWLRPL